MREWEDRRPTKDCPACGLAILVEAETSRWCHHDLAEPVAKPSSAVIMVVAAVLIVWGFVLSL